MTTTGPYLCLACTRPAGMRDDTCTAYPDGIPREILAGGDHRGPRGDERNGLVFMKRGDPSADMVFAAWRSLAGGEGPRSSSAEVPPVEQGAAS